MGIWLSFVLFEIRIVNIYYFLDLGQLNLFYCSNQTSPRSKLSNLIRSYRGYYYRGYLPNENPIQRPSRPPELAMYAVFVIFSSFINLFAYGS